MNTVAAGTRFTLEPWPWRGDGELSVMLRATDDGLTLQAGWVRSQLHLAGSVPLLEEMPCDATADRFIALIQQQDLLRFEGNVCLGDSTSGCHDHFVVIVARRLGTLGPGDEGQLVIFTIDAGGQYTTGRRIRSLQDAAAYGGRVLRHLGTNHAHGGGSD